MDLALEVINWIASIASVIALLLAIFFYQSASQQLIQTTDTLQSELASLRQISQFMLRAGIGNTAIEPIPDEDGIPKGYRVLDSLGREAIYIDPEGSGVLRITTSRPQSAIPEWEQSGLTDEALQVLVWMSKRFQDSENENKAASFGYRSEENTDSHILQHEVSGEMLKTSLGVLGELATAAYLTTRSDAPLGSEGTVFLALESTKAIFPWLRD